MNKTPYPRLPELLREVGKILETTPDNRYLDEMIAKGFCDYDQFKRNQLLIFSAWNRGDQPESESLDRKIREFGDLLLREYIAFIKEPSVAGFDRRQTVPMLLEVFLAPRLIEFLKPWTRECLGIEVGQLLSHDHPVGFAFEWISHMYPKAWRDFEEGRHKVYAGRDDNLAAWKNGDHVPTLDYLFPLLREFIGEAGLEKEEALLVMELFFMARALSELFRVTESDSYNFQSMIRERLFNSERVVDPIERLHAHYSDNLHSVMKQVKPLYRLNEEISQRLFFSQNRSEGEAVSNDQLLVKAESLCLQLEGVNAMWWRTARLRAVWFVYSGRLEEARKEYKRLFDFIFYVGMEDLDRIYHEALVVAGVCKDLVFLRELKNLGMLFGRFVAPIDAKNSNASKKHKGSEVEDWEVVQWANTFEQLFPEKRFFDGVKPITSGTALKNGQLCWGSDEMSLQISDWRDPLKQLKNVGGKRITALMYFVSLGKIDEVRELIFMGADVNQLSSSNDSALMMAIQRATPTEPGPTDPTCFEIIAEVEHHSETLNTPSDKTKLTVLGCAVDSGNPTIVRRVLEMVADVNQRCDMDQVSPLYKAVRAFSSLPKFDDFVKEFEQGSPELMESMRRHGVPGVDLPSQQKTVEQMMNNPRHREIGVELFEHLKKEQETAVSEKDLCEIIRLLLKHGANPNEAHDVNGRKGYSPLMLATELKRHDVVASMLSTDIPVKVKLNQKASLPDGRKFDVMELARMYQAHAVIDLLAQYRGYKEA